MAAVQRGITRSVHDPVVGGTRLLCFDISSDRLPLGVGQQVIPCSEGLAGLDRPGTRGGAVFASADVDPGLAFGVP